MIPNNGFKCSPDFLLCICNKLLLKKLHKEMWFALQRKKVVVLNLLILVLVETEEVASTSQVKSKSEDKTMETQSSDSEEEAEMIE